MYKVELTLLNIVLIIITRILNNNIRSKRNVVVETSGLYVGSSHIIIAVAFCCNETGCVPKNNVAFRRFFPNSAASSEIPNQVLWLSEE